MALILMMRFRYQHLCFIFLHQQVQVKSMLQVGVADRGTVLLAQQQKNSRLLKLSCVLLSWSVVHLTLGVPSELDKDHILNFDA